MRNSAEISATFGTPKPVPRQVIPKTGQKTYFFTLFGKETSNSIFNSENNLYLTLAYNANIGALSNENKYFMVLLTPVILTKAIEGDSSFDLHMKFQYTYSTGAGAISLPRADSDDNYSGNGDSEGGDGDTRVRRRGLVPVKPKDDFKSTKTYSTECHANKSYCKPFTLIYNPYIKKSSLHKLSIELREVLELDKKLVTGFKVQVRESRFTRNSSKTR